MHRPARIANTAGFRQHLQKPHHPLRGPAITADVELSFGAGLGRAGIGF
ncbi:MAG: hypothetical protein ABL918_11325 [Chakrabartia sp.]